MAKTVQGIPFDFDIDTRFSPVYLRQLVQRVLIIAGGGCVYWRSMKGKACTFCNFPLFARHMIKGPGFENFFGPWTLDAGIYRAMYSQAVEDSIGSEKLAIFNGGSFFPNSELPNDFQNFVYNDVAARPNIKQLMVEAYPDYISEKKLREAKEIIGCTDFMVGVGFESKNDTVRNVFLRKSIKKEVFEKKVRLMQSLGIQVFVYAFLKAPQLTEKQALYETLSTLQYLHDLGVDEIALSSAFVQAGTELEKKYHAGEFRPPWLWTILEIIEAAEKNNWPLSVGGFDDTPPPVAGPHNCPKCDPEVNGLIDHYRLHGYLPDYQHISCDCRSVWKKEMQG